MKRALVLVLVLMVTEGIVASSCFAQWAATYGGYNFDKAHSIQQTVDGGYIVAGRSDSFGLKGVDFWVLRLGFDGSVDWQKTYGRDYFDEAWSVVQTSEGGYIVAGRSDPTDAGIGDLWVLKLHSNGDIDWQKTYGGSYFDKGYCIQQTSDGGYVVVGEIDVFGQGNGDLWVLKLKPDGTVGWQKKYGGDLWDSAHSVQQTVDGGYIVAGRTESFGQAGDFWVLKLNPDGHPDGDGSVDWQKAYGGSGFDKGYSIRQTSDGGYVVAGETYSFPVTSKNDFWVLKLDSQGTVEWEWKYGGSSYDSARSIQQTSDGGYIVVGESESFVVGYSDIWMLKLNSDGTVDWQKIYGEDNSYEVAYSVQQTLDNGYVLAGSNSDVCLLKLDTNGEIPGCDLMGTSQAVVFSTVATVSETEAVPQTISVQVDNTTISSEDTSAIKSVACDSLAFNVKQLISCGGYLDKTQDGVLADTFVTVTHGNNRWPVAAKIIVYDKYGERVAEQPLINGGNTLENNKVPVNGLGWITLGMVVYRVTNTPLGLPGGEWFSFQIATGRSVKPSMIEVKQVVYNSRQIDPEKAIWNTANIASWSESALGGKEGTGVVKYTD